MIKERLQALRMEMKKEGIQAYIVPTSDYHDTEYVCEYFACRKYLSGFTGSAGVLVVLMDQAGLWTDGRYFIQAANQLEGTGIDLMKMGQPETPSIPAYILAHLQEHDTVAFDGKVINLQDYRQYLAQFSTKEIQVENRIDLVSRIWKDRPALPSSQTFHYEERYAGYSIDEKLEKVRFEMKKFHAASHVITKIDEIAWVLNLRASDIPHFPVALAYMTIEMDQATVYIDGTRLDDRSRELFEKANVRIKGYDDIYKDAASLSGPVLIDPHFVNSTLALSIQEPIVEAQDPIILLKACKNETEIKNTKWAHIKDGVAVTRFMYCLKHQVAQGSITECSAQDQLQKYRAQQDNYLEDSFSTICAYKDHAAMMHYSATPQSDVVLKPEGMLLVDSGGQYLEGTTDITRTFVLGPITSEEKYWFTLALRGHIRLAKATFLYGCRGLNLDILARGPLWDQMMDYQCGTGHGVGHLSNVHEAPNGFRWRIVPERNDSCVLEAGMIQSDEPGVYQEGSFGIRHENELLVVAKDQNFYGQFMGFESLTFVPFDREGIDVSLMTQDEIEWLNAYHQEVYEKIHPYLDPEEVSWLKEVTRPL